MLYLNTAKLMRVLFRTGKGTVLQICPRCRLMLGPSSARWAPSPGGRGSELRQPCAIVAAVKTAQQQLIALQNRPFDQAGIFLHQGNGPIYGISSRLLFRFKFAPAGAAPSARRRQYRPFYNHENDKPRRAYPARPRPFSWCRSFLCRKWLAQLNPCAAVR